MPTKINMRGAFLRAGITALVALAVTGIAYADVIPDYTIASGGQLAYISRLNNCDESSHDIPYSSPELAASYDNYNASESAFARAYTDLGGQFHADAEVERFCGVMFSCDSLTVSAFATIESSDLPSFPARQSERRSNGCSASPWTATQRQI